MGFTPLGQRQTATCAIVIRTGGLDPSDTGRGRSAHVQISLGHMQATLAQSVAAGARTFPTDLVLLVVGYACPTVLFDEEASTDWDESGRSEFDLGWRGDFTCGVTCCRGSFIWLTAMAGGQRRRHSLAAIPAPSHVRPYGAGLVACGAMRADSPADLLAFLRKTPHVRYLWVNVRGVGVGIGKLETLGDPASHAQWWLEPGVTDWICEELRQVLEFGQATGVRFEWI